MGRKFRVQSAAIGLLIGAGSIAILLRQVDLKQSWNALGRLNGPYIFVPLALVFLNLPLRAWRWRLIFPPAQRPGIAACIRVLAIGNMANFLLPGRAGDLARCVLLGRAGSLNESSRTLATLSVEKVLDGLALVGMVLLSIWALQPALWVIDLLRVSAFIFLGALALLIVLRYRTQTLITVVRRTGALLHLTFFESKFDGLLVSFSEGLSATTSAAQMVILIGITAVIWMTEAATIWGLAAAMGFAVAFKAAMVASAVLGLGLMIPAAPGGLGTYELFGTEAFKMVGLASSSALALTVVIHAWVFVINIALGVCMLTLQGISMSQLKTRIDAATEMESADGSTGSAISTLRS